ncbi:hypothetical protein MVEN_01567100 [Mycena venus]|uniref:Phospholipase D/nuclease n=1 Tax=Mycena venus TaxID=2733690 RepID=A0A8H6XS89_9AGAR|nr:hypothetical protein MVEN_01567100 [Mycena venus]
MEVENAEQSVGTVVKGSRDKPPKPIVVDDSETENDSEDDSIPIAWLNKKLVASARPAVVSQKKQTPKPIIVVDSDDPDAEEIVVKKPRSSNSTSTSHAGSSLATATASSASLPSKTQSSAIGSLPGRAQMEAERLARRKRMLQDDETVGDSKRQRTSAATVSSTHKTPIASRIFYDGVFFPTATVHANPRADGREAIRLQDIVGPPSSDLKLAILSSYGVGYEWLAPHFDRDVPVIVVKSIPSGERITARLFENPNWILTSPQIKNGCLHMKYMFLFYKSGRLRVVVSTANLISIDWRALENVGLDADCVFIQDVFLHSSSNVVGGGKTNHSKQGLKPEEGFAVLLESVLKATNVGPALESVNQKARILFFIHKPCTPGLPLKSISDLSKLWDWSSVTAELVPSIAGKYEGWKKIKTTGHPRLMRALETLGLATSNMTQNLVIECQGSSIGLYTTQWFNQFYISASGNSAALEAHMDLSEGKRKKLEYPRGVKVVFPTFRTAEEIADRDRDGAAFSLFCTRQKWEAQNFPRTAFHDSKSSAGKVLMHTKMIIGSFTPKKNGTPSEPSGGPAGWMYVGSHNFTQPAWGNLSGSADAPVLNVKNHELGVVVPLRSLDELNTACAWERPLEKYVAGDTAWFKDEYVKKTGGKMGSG